MFTKKMIALMVLVAMLVAGAAFAGDMEYKVYGKLHTSINYLSDSDESQIGMTSNTSRFGFKGSKELDNGFNFIWQFESGINPTAAGTSTLVNRNSFLGMSGEWGTFLYGIHDTPFKIVGRKATFFFDTIGDFRNTTFGWDRRLSNVVVYVSPDFDGFGFIGGYMLDQNSPYADEPFTAYSACAHYAKDALYVGAAFEGLSKGAAPMYDTSDMLIGYGEAQTGVRFVAKYDFGEFAVSGLFQTLSNYMGADGISAQTMGGEAMYKINDKYSVKGAFYMGDPNTDADDDDFSQMSFGIDKACGANTTMYVQFATVSNGDASGKGLGYWNGFGEKVNPSAAGESPMGFSWGWFTKF